MNKNITTRIQFVVLILLITLFFTTGSVLAEGEIIPDQITVLYRTPTHALHLDEGCVEKVESVSDTVDRVYLKDSRDAAQMIALIREDADVRAVDYESEVVAEDVPNDHYYPYQTYFKNINYENVAAGSNSVKVAVLDTGVRANHEDLLGRVEESGYNYVATNNDTTDVNGHGTGVAGVIAAQTNNGIGIAGTAKNAQVKIVPYLVLNQGGEGKLSDIAAALQTIETREDIKVVNMSFAFESSNDVIRAVSTDLKNQGKILVASSGNMERNGLYYPARFPEVFAVGAVNETNERCDSLDWGPGNGSTYGEGLDVMLPGSNIVMPGNAPDSYVRNSGTSFSAPIFSGACALALSYHPELNAEDIQVALASSCADLYSPGWDIYSGYGLLQLDRFINAASPGSVLPEPTVPTGAVVVYRLYNTVTGEHLYTPAKDEANSLIHGQGWRSEDVAWYSPASGEPVYRLFNPAISDHLYTSDANEVRVLTSEQGWVADFGGEPIFYASSSGQPVYRLYNPLTRRHLLTIDQNENTVLSTQNWIPEGTNFHVLYK